MNGFRLRYFPAALLVLGLAISQAGCQTTSNSLPVSAQPTPSVPTTKKRADQQKLTCKIYRLGDVTDDPKLGEWLVNTLPQVIKPGEWKWSEDGDGFRHHALSFYAPANVLVVNQTAAVHAQVDEFLKNLKKSLAQVKQPTPPKSPAILTDLPPEARYEASEYPKAAFDNPSSRPATRDTVTRRDPNVLPATVVTPSSPKMPDAVPINKSTAYPIPAPLAAPKHLFHLVIRYEGDGVLDAAMTDAVKAFSGGGTPAKENGDDKTKSDDAKSVSSQLLHFILRYEGDGIVDSNVVDFMKAIAEYAGRAQNSSESANPVPQPRAYATVPESIPAPQPAVMPVTPTVFPGNLQAPVGSVPPAPVLPRMMPPADEVPPRPASHQF